MRPERDIPKGCLKCPLTDALKGFKRRIKEETIKRYQSRALYPIWPFDDVSIDKAIAVYQHAASLLADNEDRLNAEWDETLAGVAKIVIAERSQARAVDDYNAEQQRRASK